MQQRCNPSTISADVISFEQAKWLAKVARRSARYEYTA